MAKIPLRAYNREIEALIERGQIEEAIAHAKYILRIFPKHIDTYRLLGKAFIEAQRYAEAADILQRILSVIPDDFVSQIGMSIIREDEGNLDAAIFHMERAFEIQPSNAAIQDELRRLFGRRDGIEPPKLRLTRGALVRMYARGDLHRQAVAEGRAALAENPERVDLEAILARMYFLLGQKVEATEVATRLISRLPFCLEANRILADTLPGSTRAVESELYRSRVNSLDPYAAYTSTNLPFSNLVPDNAVTLDHLDVEGISQAAESPDWAKDVGVELPDDQPAETESWMGDVDIPQNQPESYSTATTEPAHENELPGEDAVEQSSVEKQEGIPDWLSSAGWQPSTGETTEETASGLPLNEDIVNEEAVPAEVPDWLKSLQPQSSSGQIEGQPREETEPVPDWLVNIKTRIAGETSQPSTEEISNDTNPVSTEATDQPVSDWFAIEAEEKLPPEIEPPTGITDLAQPSTANEQNDIILPEEPVLEALPQEPVLEVVMEVPPSEEASALVEIDDGVAWLESLAARQGADQETLSTSTDQAGSEPPEWVIQELGEATALEPLPEPTEELQRVEVEISPAEFEDGNVETILESTAHEAEASISPSGLEDLEGVPSPDTGFSPPESIERIESSAGEQADATLLAVTEQIDEATEGKIGEIPEISLVEETRAPETPLVEISEAFPLAEAISEASEGNLPTTAEADSVAAEAPINYFAAETDNLSIPIQVEPAGESASVDEQAPAIESVPAEIAAQQPASENAPPVDDFDATFAWLESLAAQQGADAATLVSAPTERPSEAPAWVAESSAQTPEITDGSALLDGAAPEPELESIPIPEPAAAEIKIEESLPEPAVQEGDTKPIRLRKPLPVEEPAEQAVLEVTAPALEAESLAVNEEIQLHPEMAALPSETGVPDQVPEKEEAELSSTIEPEPLPSWLLEEEPSAPKSGLAKTGSLAPLPDWLQGIDEKTEDPLPQVSDETLSVSNWLASKQPVDGEIGEEANLEVFPSPEVVTVAPEAGQPEPVQHNDEIQTPTNPLLAQAQEAVLNGNLDQAVEIFTSLIAQPELVDETIVQIHQALARHPVDVSLWQALGDAFIQKNQIPEALDAYNKAEELCK